MAARKPKSAPRVLVTGAGGFLGSHICRHFGKAGFQVAAVGRFRATLDLAESYPNLVLLGGMTLPDPAFTEITARFKPDLLVHCAGTASVAESVANPYADFQKTADVCAFTLETLRRHAPECFFVQLSSASVYGNPGKLPVSESAPVNPISPYGFHKVLCEELVREYGALHGLGTAVLRIFSAYGEGLRKQVVHDLCARILDARGDKIEVIGTGRESRDFIHAEDVARAVACLFAAKGRGVYNLGSGTETRIDALFRLLARELGVEKKPAFLQSTRRGDPLNWKADISKLQKLGFAPKVSLRQGLAAYGRWFSAQRREGSRDASWTAVAVAVEAAR